MHGVAAEIAEEIRVLFQHRDIDAGASEEKAEHHAGRAAAGDGAGGCERCIGHGEYASPAPFVMGRLFPKAEKASLLSGWRIWIQACGKGREGSIYRRYLT